MKIVLISTGGTISMENIKNEEFPSLVKEGSFFSKQIYLDKEDSIKIINYSKLPSSNFNSSFSSKLAELIQKNLKNNDGIIITHGTDTLEETAFYLEIVLDTSKPIILTGAMRTISQEGYDGIKNVQDAVKVIKNKNSINKGVLVVFNNDVIPAVHVIKNDSERTNAFECSQTGKIGSINGKEVLFYYNPMKHINLKNKIKGRVALIKIHYDIEKKIIEKISDYADVIVLECYGSGRIPPRLLSIIKKYQSEKIIILTTRVAKGHLYDEYGYTGSYQDLKKMNVIISPLNGLKSCILAKICLGNDLDPPKIKNIFEDFFN